MQNINTDMVPSSKFYKVIFLPLILAISGIFISFLYPLKNSTGGLVAKILSYTPNIGFVVMELGAFLFAYNLLAFLLNLYARWYTEKNEKIAMIIFTIFKRVLRIIFVLISINIVISSMYIPNLYREITNKTIYGVLIAMAGWLLVQLLALAEIWFNNKWIKDHADDETYQREQSTKIRLLKRILEMMVIVFTFAAVLMLFDYMRNIGVSLLASAGLLSAIIGFAAQKPLSAIFAGFQLAFSQPIRIGDVVIIENHFGTIEEITMSYVVVKLWDSRRMVVPLNYFLDKPLENWSYKKTNLLGTFFIYADFSLPVQPIRDELKRIIDTSPLWDKESWGVHVTDFQEKSMQLRVIVSANNPGNLWTLKVEIREKLIEFINKEFPACWPKRRNLQEIISSA